MERLPVDGSSRIAAWGYDSENATLEIEFVRGGVYQYQGVAVSTWQALNAAPSAGKAFDMLIKGSYPHQKLS
jgi:KTSC domain